MLNFISLALTPTTLIAVNQKLKVPKSFKITVKATPSTYKYPELMKKKEEKGESGRGDATGLLQSAGPDQQLCTKVR